MKLKSILVDSSEDTSFVSLFIKMGHFKNSLLTFSSKKKKVEM